MITSYSNLPMGKYQRVLEALAEHTDDIDAHAAMLAILNDMTMDEVMNLPLPKYQAMSERISFLLEPLPKVKGRICKEYKFGDMVLIPTTDVKKFTAAQYIDYQQMVKEENRMVEVMSTLLVPKGHKYAQGYDIADVHRVIAEYMSVAEVMELSAFFLRKFKDLIGSMLTSLELDLLMSKEMDKMEMIRLSSKIRHLLKNGDGWTMLHK
jgi:hypothetical protein